MPVLRRRLACADDALRDARAIADSVWEMFVDWLAAGINPTRATMFIQSRVPEHAELTLLLGMIAPVGWLERVPTYKDQQQKLADRDLSNFGFLGYPVMQERRHPDLSREHGAGRRGPGFAYRARARARAPLQPHLRPRAGIRGQGAGRGEEARQQEGASATSAAHRVPGAGRRRGARSGARAARRTRRTCRSAIASGCSAISKASRRVILPEPQPLLTETPRVPGPRRPEDVEVVRQRDLAARGSGVGHQQDPHDADRSGARAANRSGQPGEVPGVAAAPDLLDARRRATGWSTAARPPASAASNASSR